MSHSAAPAGRFSPAGGGGRRRRGGFALLALAAASLVAPAAASAQAILPLDEVRAGMTGEGRTVFAGDRIETFGVEILGVLRNPFPGRSIVLARLSGGPLEHTGVMQGMSGSPVYVEGRLVGAVAYAFPFSRDPICGITPFEEMLRFTEAPVGNSASGAADAAAGRGLAPVLRFSPEGVPSLDPPLPGRNAAPAFAGAGAPAPILSPVSVSGLDPAVAGVIAPVFRQLGMEIAPGGVSVGGSATTGGGPQRGEPAGEPAGEPPAPVPGSPIGAALIGGDLVMMASGTVTHVDEATGEVFAFGHPFTGLGTLAVPMQEARVEAAVASLANSFKLTSAGRPLGVWRQDRATGVRGELGARAPLVPLELTVGGSRGARRTYRLELVDHDLLTPLLAFSGLMSALAQEERLSGPQTMRLEARLGVAGGRTLALEDVFASGASGSLQQAAALVAAPIALLLGNPLERIPVRRVEVEVSATETARTAALTRAWIESARVRPGETVTSIYRTAKAIWGHMRARGGGVILNTASIAGLIGTPGQVAYGTSKGAVVTLTKCLALDGAKDRIRVNCICPGWVRTPMVDYHLSRLDDPEGFAARLEKLHPLGVGDPASVAGGFVYLASDEATWITGIALTIDGGVSCGLVPE